MLDKKPNEAHVETCGAGYSEYAMCDSPEACADLRNAPVVEPESCRYTQPDGARCTRPGEPRHGMCGPHYWARDDEGHAPVVEPSPVCGARVDYHGGTCGKPVGHDEPCTPVVEPDPRCVRGLPAGNCCERYDTCELVDAEACSPDDYETGPERVRDELRAERDALNEEANSLSREATRLGAKLGRVTTERDAYRDELYECQRERDSWNIDVMHMQPVVEAAVRYDEADDECGENDRIGSLNVSMRLAELVETIIEYRAYRLATSEQETPPCVSGDGKSVTCYCNSGWKCNGPEALEARRRRAIKASEREATARIVAIIEEMPNILSKRREAELIEAFRALVLAAIEGAQTDA